MFTASSSYLFSRILSSPKEIIFTLLIFILSKSLNATAFQLTVIAFIKSISSLFSFYISSILHNRSHLIPLYLVFNILAGAIPCFFYPWIDNVWFYIASYAIHMVTMRAQDPAWIEILKNELALPSMGRIISKGSSIYYFGSMSLPPLLSLWLDRDPYIWKTLYFSFASLQLIALLPLFFIKIPSLTNSTPSLTAICQLVVAPLHNGWKLLVQRPSFRDYLFLFFLGGAGIVATQPLLPKYFEQTLRLSYTELTLAFSFCQGISFILSSPIWAKYMPSLGLYRLNALMNLLTCCFFTGLIIAQLGLEWLYVAYLFYGIMQGGSEITWNLSGPIFAQKEDSTPYTSLNLVLRGIRGCICPFLGYLLFSYTNLITVFLLALFVCFIGIPYGLWLNRKYPLNLIKKEAI